MYSFDEFDENRTTKSGLTGIKIEKFKLRMGMRYLSSNVKPPGYNQRLT
jgi:hypothetical protein